MEEFKDLISLVIAKGIKPLVGLVVPLEEAAEGFRKRLAGETEGKIVVTV